MVEEDFSARLTRQGQLKHGREGMRAMTQAQATVTKDSQSQFVVKAKTFVYENCKPPDSHH